MLATSGCTTYRPITGTANPQITGDLIVHSVKTGDTVKIVTKDGRYMSFKVQEIGPESMSGENHSVSFGEIAKLEKREISEGKTNALGLVVTAAVVAGVVVLIIHAIADAAAVAAFAGG